MAGSTRRKVSALAHRLKPLRGWLVPVLLLLAWQHVSHRDAAHSYAFAPLEQVFTAVVEVIRSGDLWTNLKGSLLRTSLGLVLGVVFGVAVGASMAFSRVVHTLVSPLYHGIRQVPLLGLTPLISLWMGTGEPAKVFVIGLAAFYPMVLNTYEGLRHVDPRHQEVGHLYGFSRFALLYRVQLPAALPGVLTGLVQAVPFAWITAIGAELLFNAGAGLGNLMAVAETGGRMDIIVVCAVATTVLGIAMSYAASQLSLKLNYLQRGH